MQSSEVHRHMDEVSYSAGSGRATNGHRSKRVLKSLICMTNREDVRKGICGYTNSLH